MLTTGTRASSKNGTLAASSMKSLRALASLVRGHVLLERGRCRLHRHRLAQQLTQMQLLRVGQRRVALALLAEDLAPEPFDLGAQPLDLCGLRAQQLRHVLHVHGGQFRRIGHAREHCV
jgi:hypothetical protein